jgi:hypothetical protein
MRYDVKIPVAATDDLAEVFRSQDPIGAVNARLAELAALAQQIDAEQAKWQRALGAAEVFRPGPPEAQSNGSSAGIETPEASETPGQDAAPNTRRQAIVRILEEEPTRVWRTRELVYELFRRAWNTADNQDTEANSVSRLLGELEKEDAIFKLRKGNYSFRRPAVPLAENPFMTGEDNKLEPNGRIASDGERTGSNPPGGSA